VTKKGNKSDMSSWEDKFQLYGREGDTWHVVSRYWWDSWCAKSGFVDPLGEKEIVDSEPIQEAMPTSSRMKKKSHDDNTQRHSFARLRKIDNSNLVVHSAKQQVQNGHTHVCCTAYLCSRTTQTT
jgi:hypothetical protein